MIDREDGCDTTGSKIVFAFHLHPAYLTFECFIKSTQMILFQTTQVHFVV